MSFQDPESEIIDLFLEDQQKLNEAKNEKSWLSWMTDDTSIEQPIEYSQIDFQWMIIGEKLKKIDDADEPKIFDDDYFASLILEQEENLEFFSYTFIQNIIDYQFEKLTRFFMINLFLLYFFCFCLPYMTTLVSNDPETIISVFKLCFVPQIFLLCIEVV